MKLRTGTMCCAAVLLACLPLRSQDIQRIGDSGFSISFAYSKLNAPIAGVAGGRDVVFVGEPLNGAVVAPWCRTGPTTGAAPPPPRGSAGP